MSAIYGTSMFIANSISVSSSGSVRGVSYKCLQVRLVDRIGRVTMLKIALPSLVGLLIYSALMGRFFNAGDDKVGKGFAILGLYLYTFTYCA